MTTHNWVRWRFINGHEPLGQFGERLWANIFRSCGLFYIPLKDLPASRGKGPRLQGTDDILPDFHLSGARNAYVDSKCKSGPVLYRNANELRQGVDRKCWESYRAISEINRQKCIIAIVEIFHRCNGPYGEDDWRGALLMQSLGHLGKPCEGFSTMSHMVVWPRSRFVELTPGTAPLNLWNLAHGDGEVSDDLRRRVRRVVESPEVIQGRLI